MSGLGGPAPAVGKQGGGATVDTAQLMQNHQKANYIRLVVLIVCGCLTGVAGITGIAGFAVFVAAHLVCSLVVGAMSNFNTMAYLRLSLAKSFYRPVMDQLVTFILFWTLFYALVRLFDVSLFHLMPSSVAPLVPFSFFSRLYQALFLRCCNHSVPISHVRG